MITLENAKVALKGKWLSIKVVGKNGTKVKAKDLYVDSDVNKHNSVLSYYDSLLKESNNSSLSMLKALLSEKNVNAFYLRNNLLKLYFNKEPMFFNKKPEVTIALYSPDIKDNKINLLDISFENYKYSRQQFLDDATEKENVKFIINTKSDISSYDNFDNNYIFNLSDINDFLYKDEEKEFLMDIIENILLKSDDTCYVNYDVITVTKNSMLYYIKNLTLELSDKIVEIDLVSDNEFEKIMDMVYTHNNKIGKNYVKKQKERRNYNE